MASNSQHLAICVEVLHVNSVDPALTALKDSLGLMAPMAKLGGRRHNTGKKRQLCVIKDRRSSWSEAGLQLTKIVLRIRHGPQSHSHVHSKRCAIRDRQTSIGQDRMKHGRCSNRRRRACWRNRFG